MIHLTPQMRILAAIDPVDLNKGIDGLAGICRQRIKSDPFSGCVFDLVLLWGLTCVSYSHIRKTMPGKKN